MAGEIVNSSSSSVSNPISMDSPEIDWGLQLSQMLSSLGVSMINWAQGVYAQTAATVGPAIQQAMSDSAFSLQQAQTLWQQYTSTYAPEMQLYAQEAGDYGSVARQQFMAGQAESATAQAEQQARQNALQTLTEEGVNPSSGAYQEAELAAQTAAGAAEAGAGTEAAMNTAAQGRQMLLNSIGVGEQLPGATVNAINSGLSGLANAENASIGLGNLGVAATQAGVGYENAASSADKIPPVGQKSVSASQTSAQPGGQNQGSSGQGQVTPTNNNAQGVKAASDGNSSFIADPGWGGTYTPPGPGQNAGAQGIPGSQQGLYPGGQSGNSPQNMGGYDNWSTPNNPNANVAAPGTNPEQEFSGQTIGSGNNQITLGGQPGPNPGMGGGDSGGNGLSNFFSNLLNSEPSMSGANGNPNDTTTGSPGSAADGSGLGNPLSMFSTPAQADTMSFQPQQMSGGGDNYSDNPDPNAIGGGDNGGDNGGYNAQPQSQPQDNGGDYSFGGGYAKGGQVRKRGVIPTTGGYASKSQSPSGGRQTDDINARLNAGEYVVPRDVVHDKGHEFFRNLIQKSRKNRLGAGAAQKPIGPQMKPGLSGPPSFVSRAIPSANLGGAI
jgi:hypothetical protein